MRILILLFLLAITNVQAHPADDDRGIFYVLDEKSIDNINDLPTSAGTPDKHIQESDNIEGWIDITGFRQMSREHGVTYVPGNPVDYAIVQSDADCMPSGILDSCDETVSLSQSGNNITASLDITMRWHTVYCDKQGCYISGRFIDIATFQDTELAPQIYPKLQDFRANVTQYNNSLYENIGISIANISGLNKYVVQYGDNIATYQLKSAVVEQTAKGVYFANITLSKSLDLKGKNISRYGNMILLNGNLSQMNAEDIKITGSNLYETKIADVNQINATRQEFKPEKELENPVMIAFMCVLTAIFGGIYFMIQRMRF